MSASPSPSLFDWQLSDWVAAQNSPKSGPAAAAVADTAPDAFWEAFSRSLQDAAAALPGLGFEPGGEVRLSGSFTLSSPYSGDGSTGAAGWPQRPEAGSPSAHSPATSGTGTWKASRSAAAADPGLARGCEVSVAPACRVSPDSAAVVDNKEGFSSSASYSGPVPESHAPQGLLGQALAIGGGTQIFDNSIAVGVPHSFRTTTVVAEGTMVINGDHSSDTSSLLVSNQGTRLKGSGVFGGSFVLTAGAVHAPGNSPGIQTFNNGVTYSSGSVFEWELAGSAHGVRGIDYDGVNVGGKLSGSGAIFRVILAPGAFTDSFWNTDQVWTDVFMNRNGNTPRTYQSIFSTIEWYEGTVDMTSNTGLQGFFSITGSSLRWSVLPEPGNAAVALLLAAGLLRRRRTV